MNQAGKWAQSGLLLFSPYHHQLNLLLAKYIIIFYIIASFFDGV